MTAPTVGLALIAKDEQETLPRLLASIEGAFDRVVLLDTGSTDDTRQVFERWAADERGRHPGFTCDVDTFTWTDDFSDARNAADGLLLAGPADGKMKTYPLVDWKVWADCDDEIHGAHELRRIAASARPELHAFIADYDYAQDENGTSVCRLRRERLVRATATKWAGRVHEHQVIQGPVVQLPPHLVEWRHRKPPHDDTERNLKILTQWLEDEPENARVLCYVGTEQISRGRLDDGIATFRRYLTLKGGWDEERAQVHRKMAIALLAQGKHEEAIQLALEALALLPGWPDSHLTLAEAHYQKREHAKALDWATQVLNRGVPDTMLIVNPLDYLVQARVILAGALAGLQRIEEAVEVAEQALQIVPGHPHLLPAYHEWRGIVKREQTASTFIACAEMLVAHDEQLKALTVLDTVPHYAIDHPGVVNLRSVLRERVLPLFDTAGYAEHYETGGSKPEDFIPDDEVLDLGDRLPRCAFLLQGLQDQLAVA